MRRKHVPTLCLIAPFCLACPTRSGLTTDSCWQHVPTFCLMTLLALHSSFKYIHYAKSVYLLAARITQQDMLHLFRKQQCRVDLSRVVGWAFGKVLAIKFDLPWWQNLIPALRWSIDHEEEICSDTLSDCSFLLGMFPHALDWLQTVVVEACFICFTFIMCAMRYNHCKVVNFRTYDDKI